MDKFKENLMDPNWIKYKIRNEYVNKRNWLKELLLKKEFSISDLHSYAGKDILSVEETNKFIEKKIIDKQPFMVCRFGQTEMNMIVKCLQHNHFPYRDQRMTALSKLCKNAGFFPKDINAGEEFVKLMLEDCQYIDLCGIWNLYMEDYILDKYAGLANVTLLGSLEPWNVDSVMIKPWTNTLKGKKVLVIHPFAETINSQYYNWREHLFERKFASDDILPEFELITLKAVQTINYSEECGDFADWFAALNYMIEKCKNIDFDIAIIGCGAYGFPLAAAIKRMGKGAVHLGGATQILFVIVGRRWEINSGYRKMLEKVKNDSWTRPSAEETPDGAEEIEGGCYW